MSGDILPASNVVVDGVNWDSAISGAGRPLVVTNCNTLTISNIVAVGDGLGTASDAILLQNTDGLIVKNSTFSNWGRHGLHLLGDSHFNFLIEEVESHNNSQS